MIISKPLGEYDFILFSTDRKSTILFTFLEIELERYPSISFRIHIKDHLFIGEINVWVEKEKIDSFLRDVKELNSSRKGKVSLESMSPEELELTIQSERVNLFLLNYSIKQTKYLNNKLIETTLKGTFEFDSEFFNELEQNVKAIDKLTNI
ncbi:hypothetical protein PUW24_18925 [Paenibacillus urinalis]|uniref:Uncharacterized protein n=1 Tax=Paenibacillus urinalis TaxID=521520 RepID=A0ABY7XF89_9BACL|nr:hypothetical protein [Paenibacillus urinalis]WDH96235.1 hypothetical protein PUW24_18925 [Paenibacillus urinalis]WDI04458.1 hypothetical protein PUW25_11090 [Paenibacillus urinalis]